MKSFFIAVTGLLLLCNTSFAKQTANWPGWRGPSDNSVAEGDFPVEFSPEQNLLWKAELPGIGSSTPVVWGEFVFVTCSIPQKEGPPTDAIACYQFERSQPTADTVWLRPLGPGKNGKHPNGSGANPSPVTDGKVVVAYFKSGRLSCWDFDGNRIWEKNLQEMYGENTLWWDLGTSPVLAGDKVVVAVMQEGDSYMVAFNLGDGEVAWKTRRQYKRPRESDQAYTTPHVIKQGGALTIVTWGADHLSGHDAATGNLVWECGGFNPEEKGMWRVIASAAVTPEVAVVPYGRAEHLAAVSLKENHGDITADAELWRRHDLGADVPTPIIHGDQVFVLGDKRQLTKLDLQTGKTLDEFKLPKNRNKYYASPILAGGNLYCTREDGTIFVVSTENEFEVLAENELGEKTIATPVAVRNRLLVRGEKHLFLFGSEN
ncbi:MAG: PQQ-binding-like beta-propeller repeat protein [Lacipirellulaceae bacterium]